ncbi:hypothetical protein BGZ96_000292, partial [Linnemannia gamsii]
MLHSAGSVPPSPLPTPSEVTGAGGLGVGLGDGVAETEKRPEEHFPDSTTMGSLTIAARHTTATGTSSTGTTVADSGGVAEFERAEGCLHESNFHLPLYSFGGGLGFDTQWSLRAIPDWFP